MGGCASAPKDLKKDGGGGSAPAPEPSREEETVEAEQEGVEKVGEENSEKIGGDKKSLGSLLDEVRSNQTPYDKFLIRCIYVIFCNVCG